MFQLKCERELAAYTQIVENNKRFEGTPHPEPQTLNPKP